MLKGYVGTYSSNKSEGIYSYEFDELTGILQNPKLFKSMKNSKYITCDKSYVYSLFDGLDGSGLCVMDLDGNEVDSLLSEDCTSCYLTVKEDKIYTANYHEGTVSVYRFSKNKLSLIEKIVIQEKAGAHQVMFYEDWLLVPCLLLDVINVYDNNYSLIKTIHFPKESGPRHGVFSLDNHYLYVVSELSNELFIFKIEDSEFIMVNQLSILPNGVTHCKDSAAIRLSKDGTTLYCSTRSLNILSTIKVENESVEVIQCVDCGGNHPRDFILSKDNGYMIVANRLSNTLVSFELVDDRIGKQKSSIEIPEGVSIAMEENYE